VGDVERKIREIKERSRCTVNELPFKHCMPDQGIIHLIYFVVLWINSFPTDNGVSETYAPREIVTGMKLDFTKHCKVEFGAYVEASFDDEITNTLKERTHSCISLGTSGNFQGSIKCLNLETGRVVKRRTVRVLPMPERVVKHVIKMGKKSRQSRSADTLEFLNRHKEKYDWDNEELEIEEGLVEDEPHPDLLAEIPGVPLESDYESDDVVEVPEVTELEIAEQAARNANLAASREGPDKVTGVDLHPPIVIEDEDEQDGNEDASQASGGSDGDVVFVGEHQ
jgi:hypothetical protein